LSEAEISIAKKLRPKGLSLAEAEERYVVLAR